MAFPILQTKLFIPMPRPALVARPHLLRRLDAAVQTGQRLVLISSMAGSGKTTLLSEWVNRFSQVAGAPPQSQPEIRTGWLSLDEEDNDPVRFWLYLAAALQAASPGLGLDLLQAVGSPQPPPLQFSLVQTINAAAGLSGKLVLILDDYHVLSNRAIHENVAFLLDHLPPQMLVVIATRADPPLPLGRLRARGQLTELRVSDLHFSAEEAAGFLNSSMGLKLGPDAVEALEARTEGWIVGLQLAALALQALPGEVGPDAGANAYAYRRFIQSFTGSHQFLLDYLTEEVLSRQSPEVQSFLVRTSILERMCGELCEEVTSQQVMKDDRSLVNSLTTLSYLERSNLFLIPLDAEGRWFRYHHLFAGLLQNRLKLQASPAEIADLHSRASRWFEDHGFVDEAVRHAQEAGDAAGVAEIVLKAAEAGMLNGRVATLLNWFNWLPPELYASRPNLRLRRAWACFLNGQYDLARQMLTGLERDLTSGPDTSETHNLLGEVYSDLATLAATSAGPAEIIALAGKALEYLPEENLAARARTMGAQGAAYGLGGEMGLSNQALQTGAALAERCGNTFLNAHMLEMLAGNLGHQGRLRECEQVYERIVALAEASPPAGGSAASISLGGIGSTGLAGISLERNQLETAGSQLQKGSELCRQAGILYNLIDGFLIEARLRKALGDRPGALDAFRRGEQVYLSIRSLPFAVALAAEQVRLGLWAEGLDRILSWQDPEQRISVDDIPMDILPVSVREVQWVTLARLRWMRGQLDEALEIHDWVCATAEPGGRWKRVMEIGLLKALALQLRGEVPAAAAALQRVLELAMPEGYTRLFLDEGPAFAQLARACRKDLTEAQGEFVDILLAELGGSGPVAAEAGPAGAVGMVAGDELSERELEVLRLVEMGLSNQEIAENLVVSLNTVKKHTSNIFAKLGVASRTQAVALARQKGLL